MSEKIDRGIGILFIAGIIGFFYWISPLWYAVEYQVSPRKVEIAAQPSDCDSMHAPLGSKACHYKANVTAYNAAGEVVSDNGVPRQVAGRDPIVQFVVVSWTKVEGRK